MDQSNVEMMVTALGDKVTSGKGSQEKEIVSEKENGGNKAAAVKVGKALATRALEKGIKSAAFDRGQYRYHGRVAALADAAREVGLQF